MYIEIRVRDSKSDTQRPRWAIDYLPVSRLAACLVRPRGHKAFTFRIKIRLTFQNE